MTTMTREKARAIQIDVEAALKKIAAAHGMTGALEGGVTYDENRCTVRGRWKLTGIALAGATAGKPTDFDSNARRVGADPSWWGRQFLSRGRTMTVTNIKTRNRKYPVLCTDAATGETYKFTTARVSALLR